MHKFVVSKSWWNCNRLVYTPNFGSLIWKSFYKLFKSHIADIALRRYTKPQYKMFFFAKNHFIIRKEIWLYFSNLLRKWKFTMKENSSNPNVFFALSNASDVFWLKWQITQQDGVATWKTSFEQQQQFLTTPESFVTKCFCETYLYSICF